MSKISRTQHKELIGDIFSAKEELAELEEELEAIKQVFDNCSNCNGKGNVEDGYGDPGHNPYQNMLYRDCPKCEGKGYIE